ncbi:MAG: hypothetical protein K8S13_01645 [Desulfobacula sp.]|uniref:hypothetical protein n=1 Tax=Desulfobacula sp. TaxID=2593537 RepID=UPI0025BF4995|nr:hypothetical protein [Desulfobacula sp.]MCD4718552.1 hypothetical protein [Desulfobacula sp.]
MVLVLRTSCIFVLLTLIACSSNIARHNYLVAGDVSKQYFQHLFLNENYTVAYEMMHGNFKKKFSQAQLEELLIKTHDGSIPKQFEIMEYEIYSGQEFISVFINTKNQNPNYFYRVTLTGTKDKGYLIAGFHISTSQIAAEGKRLPYDPIIAISEV